MHDLRVLRELGTHAFGREFTVMRHQTHCAGIGALANAPDMQIGNTRITRHHSGCNGLAYFFYQRV